MAKGKGKLANFGSKKAAPFKKAPAKASKSAAKGVARKQSAARGSKAS